MPAPPPAPRPAFRQPVPFPLGYKPVRPAPASENLQDRPIDDRDLEEITAEDFQAMRVPIEEDEHDPKANADTDCKCGACLWYSLFYAEFLVDWYEAMPGQAPPHPMHVGENKLIKASIGLFGYPTVPFPFNSRMSNRPSEEVMRRLDNVHDENVKTG